MNITVVIQQMIIIFILIGIGLFLYRKKMLSETTSGQISGLIVNVTNPALLICSVLNEGPRVSLQELGTAVCVDLAIYVLLIAVSYLIPRILREPDKEHYSYQMLTIFGNVGFIGIPFISAVLGTEAMIFVSIYNLFYNVLIYTFGNSLLQRAADRRAAGRQNKPLQQSLQQTAADSDVLTEKTVSEMSAPVSGAVSTPWWKKIINVGTISAAITIIIYLSNLRLPAVLTSTLTHIGQSTTMLSMFVLGVSVARMAVKDIFAHPKLYGFVLLRQILLPIGCSLLLRPLLGSTLLLNTTVLLLAMPAGNMPLLLSKQLQLDTDTISQGIIITTILGLVTIPMVSMFL